MPPSVSHPPQSLCFPLARVSETTPEVITAGKLQAASSEQGAKMCECGEIFPGRIGQVLRFHVIPPYQIENFVVCCSLIGPSGTSGPCWLVSLSAVLLPSVRRGYTCLYLLREEQEEEERFVYFVVKWVPRQGARGGHGALSRRRLPMPRLVRGIPAAPAAGTISRATRTSRPSDCLRRRCCSGCLTCCWCSAARPWGVSRRTVLSQGRR